MMRVMKKLSVAALAGSVLVWACGCEKQNWDETKVLYQDHGGHHVESGEHHPAESHAKPADAHPAPAKPAAPAPHH